MMSEKKSSRESDTRVLQKRKLRVDFNSLIRKVLKDALIFGFAILDETQSDDPSDWYVPVSGANLTFGHDGNPMLDGQPLIVMQHLYILSRVGGPLETPLLDLLKASLQSVT